jgi:hypothetical protein
MPKFPPRSGATLLSLIACAAVSACGGSAMDHSPKNVCRHAQKAAAGVVGHVALHIADSDPANIECVLRTQPLKIDLVAQASPRAWEQFDTIVVHQAQAFAGSNSTKDLPQDVPGLGYNAAWIASSHEFVATNGSQSSGGSFLTVTVTPRSAHGPSSLKVAKAVATATLAVAPKGPSPGPAPS